MEHRVSGIATAEMVFPARSLSGVGVIVSIAVVALGLRPAIVSVGNVLTIIIADFHMSYTAASLLTALPPLLMGLLAIPTPVLARRYGRDRLLLAALTLLALSTVARAFSAGSASLLLATIGVGAGIAVAGTLIPGLIKARYSERALPIIGIYATCLSLGGLIAAAVTGIVLEHTNGDWRLATGIWSGSTILAMVGGYVATRSLPTSARLNMPCDQPGWPLRESKAWLAAAYFSCTNFLFFGMTAWLSPMLQSAGLSASAAGFALSSFIAGFMIASPILGILSRSSDRRVWLAASAGLAVFGFVAIPLVPAAAYAMAPIAALGLGGAFTLSMMMPLDNARSAAEADIWTAFSMAVSYVVGAAGPVVIGLLHDMTGGFTASSWLMVGVAFVMVAISPFLRPILTRPVSG